MKGLGIGAVGATGLLGATTTGVAHEDIDTAFADDTFVRPGEELNLRVEYDSSVGDDHSFEVYHCDSSSPCSSINDMDYVETLEDSVDYLGASYDNPGFYTVFADVDTGSGTIFTEFDFVVSEEDQLLTFPEAKVDAGPTNEIVVSENEEVTLSGADSEWDWSDVNGAEITEYVWSGDGVGLAVGDEVTISYEETGTYTVTLRVTGEVPKEEFTAITVQEDPTAADTVDVTIHVI
ncbi:hypothetical protein GCM10025298_28220 [Natronobiforma cellulositropha]